MALMPSNRGLPCSNKAFYSPLRERPAASAVAETPLMRAIMHKEASNAGVQPSSAYSSKQVVR